MFCLFWQFVIDQDDYITSVKVYYEKLYGLKTDIITALIFKTFKGINLSAVWDDVR